MQKKVAAIEQTAKSQLLREDNAKKINRIPIVPPPAPCKRDSLGNQNEAGASVRPMMNTARPGQVRSLNFIRIFIEHSSKPFESLPHPIEPANYTGSYGNGRATGLNDETPQSQRHGATLYYCMVIPSELFEQE